MAKWLLILLLCVPGAAMPDNKRPLIFGASVSADYLAKSPMRRLAESQGQTPEAIAYVGDRGALSRILGELSDEQLARTSKVYSLDSLYWDTYKSPEVGIGALEALLAKTQKAGVPVVMGNVPEIEVPWLMRLFAGAAGPSQISHEAVNKRLGELCTPAANCSIYDVVGVLSRNKDKMHDDGLHLTDALSEIIAKELGALK